MEKGKSKYLILVFLFVALALHGCGSSGGGGSGEIDQRLQPKVFFSPTSDTQNVGNTFTKRVEVENVEGIFYVAFDVTFDSNVIEFLSAAEGNFLNRNGADPILIQALLQNGQQGRVVLGVTGLGQIGEATGNGTLLTLTFKAVAPGNTNLLFNTPRGFRNSSNQDVPINFWENGSVTVN